MYIWTYWYYFNIPFNSELNYLLFLCLTKWITNFKVLLQTSFVQAKQKNPKHFPDNMMLSAPYYGVKRRQTDSPFRKWAHNHPLKYYKTQLKRSIALLLCELWESISRGYIATNQILSLHVKLNYPYGEAQQYIWRGSHACREPRLSPRHCSLPLVSRPDAGE